MHYRALAMVTIGLLCLLGAIWIVAAQDSVECATTLETFFTAASDACISGPLGYICNGGGAPGVEPAGQIASALASVGSLVETGVVDAIRTPPFVGGSGGVAWLRHSAPLQYTAFLVGDAAVRDVTPPDFPAWQSVVVQTMPESPTCVISPRASVVFQSPFAQPVNIVINGMSVVLNGTVLVQTAGAQTVFAGLSGVSSLFAYGQEQLLRPGQEVLADYNPGDFSAPLNVPAAPVPLDTALAAHLPVALFDRPIILPQPGYVETLGAVNLRVAPTTDAGVIVQVPAGQVLSVLGRNTGGDWYHVRLDSGETGWMKIDLLAQNVGQINAVYEATPLPPQRYGALGRIATVLAPAGVNLRSAPDATFPLILTIPDGTVVNLVARSPYSPWVKVEVNGIEGWLALITIQTEAVIEALPVDYNVPPPPEPTREPGSFGNAFPNPNNPGN